MKSRFFSLLVIFFISIDLLHAQSPIDKKDPAGKWKFEAPYAPEGFTSGIISVSLSEDKYSVELTFTGMEYKLNAEKVKVRNDSLLFSILVEDQYVSVFLKHDDPSKMSGKAVYSDGTLPLALTRESVK